MILVVTNRSDLTADWLVLELRERGTPYVRFNTEDFPLLTTLSWSAEDPSNCVLKIHESELALASITAVWYRRPFPPSMRPDLGPDEAEWASRESAAALQGVWKTLICLWVNRPENNRVAEDKLEQLRRASSLGLTVPSTLVTNDPSEAQEFVSKCATGAVCKPIRDGRPKIGGEERIFFTTEVTDVSGVGPEPYLFQELIPKRSDLRVTVIGNEAFAAEIDSQQTREGKIDWRRSAPLPAHEPTFIPAEVVDKCLALTRSYDLRFAAIDLARTPDDSCVFFEINPNGQWVWIQHATGLPLRQRLADLLQGGR